MMRQTEITVGEKVHEKEQTETSSAALIRNVVIMQISVTIYLCYHMWFNYFQRETVG